MKPPSLIDSEGGFAIYCLVFEGFVPGGAGPFFVDGDALHTLFIEKQSQN